MEVEKKHYLITVRGIYDGVMYGAAIYSLPVALGNSLVSQGRATVASKADVADYAEANRAAEAEVAAARALKVGIVPQQPEAAASAPGKPSTLTAEETIQRMLAGDISDETLEGIRTHRDALLEMRNNQGEGSLAEFAKAEADRANAEIVPNKNEVGNKPEGGEGSIAEKLNSERGANEPNALDALPPTTEGGNSTEGENGGQGGNALEETDDNDDDETGGNGGGTGDGNDLPENLPFRRELVAGGVTSMEQLTKMTKAQLIEIKGVKDVAAQRIGAFLAGNE